jgi:glyceraldehyde-3-phosphate dehydrogenase (NADP+)
METYPLYCGGKFLEKGKPHDVTSKYDDKVMARTFLAGRDTLNAALGAAEEAKGPCAESTSLERSKWLRAIHDGLVAEKDALSKLLSAESGKPIIYGSAEIGRAIQCFLIASEECKRPPREYLALDWTENGRNREGLVRYFPRGVVAGIAPFNFPMNLAVHKIAPAIAAGCPIVVKPASATPLSTLALARIIARAGLPEGMVSILPMDRETGNHLVVDDRPALLSFTGSPDVGWSLKKQAGKKKVVLELGGNAAVVVGNTSVREIVQKCMTGAFAYSGQICIHAQRFYVHPDVFGEFRDAMTEAAQMLRKGDPLDPETRISVMIDEENAARVEEWVANAVKDGARLLCGGKRKGSYYEPTVLTGTTTRMRVNSEEVFGPVICIEEYNGDIADAVKKVNDTRFGLQCGIFTDSVSDLDYAFRNLAVGGVIHNDSPSLRFDQMPYGGIRDSGLGREGIRYAMHDMLEARVLVK